MPKPTHDIEMRDVYANVYQSSYELTPEAMAVATNRVSRNLEEFSISKVDLSRMNVLNVGPGREALALHNMGARRVYHFDISDLAVGAINRAKSSSSGFDNITSVRRDLCAAESLPISDGIDFVYLSGVLHHLHDPSQALANIFAHLNPGAKLFFRIYRSGSLYYFCCDFIRKFIRYDDRDAVMAEFRERNPVMTPETQILHNGVWDDFFVPVLRLYKPSEVDKFFGSGGFVVAVPASYPLHDHQNTRNDGQGVSLYYTLNTKSPGVVKSGSFPTHTDQLSDISYEVDYINQTIDMMNRFVPTAASLTAATRAAVAIKVHRLGHIRSIQGPVTAAGQHALIQEALAPFT